MLISSAAQHCLGHLITLVDHLTLYARTPSVRQFTQRVNALAHG